MAIEFRDGDTIAAIATGAAAGGIGIVRVSGPDAFGIAEALSGKAPKPREAVFTQIRDRSGNVLDQGLLITFKNPSSFTGEDVVEFQCHGGPVLLQTLLRECIALGARQAQPGEFSQRAFINGKLDLVQAEAIADLINSSTEAAARSASRSLNGAFSTRVNELLQTVIRLRVFVEAAIDFPEEEIDFIAESDVMEQLAAIEIQLTGLLSTARRGKTLRDGMKLVIAGAPNAGKSSLLNQLAQQDSAIVTDIPGTTRDVLREHIQIEGLPLHIVDTAGLRDTADPVEQEGVRRAHSEIQSADRILFVADINSDGNQSAESLLAPFRSGFPDNTPITFVWNKTDLLKDAQSADQVVSNSLTEIFVSAQSGDGIDALRQHLLESAGLGAEDSSDFSARERHVRALETCLEHLVTARRQLQEHGAAELVAEDLRYVQDSLGQITGAFSSDALLGEIFGSFCIGK
ncbi:MAG: tRNA uridine-5-carboxymethylaminomethyl(34) synthesis GTPase MnmE [Congregibacter sp.]